MSKVDYINGPAHESGEQKKSVEKSSSLIQKLTPWMAGAGIAVGHIITSSSCTVPQQGRCSTCGGCVVALGSLVAWAVVKKRNGNEFYLDDSV